MGRCKGGELTARLTGDRAWAARLVGVAQVAFWTGLMVVMYGAVAQPMPGGSTGVLSVYDKLTHTGVYAVLTGLGLLGRQRPLTLLAVLSLHGVSIEVLQAFSPHRTPDWRDLMANGLGVALALLASRIPPLRSLGADRLSSPPSKDL